MLVFVENIGHKYDFQGWGGVVSGRVWGWGGCYLMPPMLFFDNLVKFFHQIVKK